jgi:tRNA-specific 2-thiouridylase
VADARNVAHALGIAHYVVDEAEEFERTVIQYFAREYQAGRTPNPCVMCNEKLKFGNLWDRAEALGCDYIATGHYAIIEHGGDGRATLRKGVDPQKDQSYFLFSLRQHQLRRALTPLGPMTKPEIRRVAHQLGLKVADKPDSQEICFVPGNDYKEFLRSHLKESDFHRGGIYDLEGNYLGDHDGIELFTIGQRKGLPGGSAQPRYVVDIDAATHRVIVGGAGDLDCEEFEVDNCNWIVPAGSEIADVEVKIRYSHVGTAATVAKLPGSRAQIRLHQPQRAITPGQAAVVYDGDMVLGGGWICRADPVNRAKSAPHRLADSIVA